MCIVDPTPGAIPFASRSGNSVHMVAMQSATRTVPQVGEQKEGVGRYVCANKYFLQSLLTLSADTPCCCFFVSTKQSAAHVLKADSRANVVKHLTTAFGQTPIAMFLLLQASTMTILCSNVASHAQLSDVTMAGCCVASCATSRESHCSGRLRLDLNVL